MSHQAIIPSPRHDAHEITGELQGEVHTYTLAANAGHSYCWFGNIPPKTTMKWSSLEGKTQSHYSERGGRVIIRISTTNKTELTLEIHNLQGGRYDFHMVEVNMSIG